MTFSFFEAIGVKNPCSLVHSTIFFKIERGKYLLSEGSFNESKYFSCCSSSLSSSQIDFLSKNSRAASISSDEALELFGEGPSIAGTPYRVSVLKVAEKSLGLILLWYNSNNSLIVLGFSVLPSTGISWISWF